MSPQVVKKPHGEVRQSQLITTFGPGALLDLPKYSVIVGGLDTWSPGEEIVEPRLTQKVREILGDPDVRLTAPPIALSDFEHANAGIRVYQFPEWFVARSESSSGEVKRRAMVHRKGLVNGRFLTPEGKKLSVVPVRFVKACPKGHISDIDWFEFVHRGSGTACRNAGRQLWMEERGTSGDLSEIHVVCSCNKAERAMIEGMKMDLKPFPPCGAERPWLGPQGRDSACGAPSRLLIRTASNAYFPQIMRVISLPEKNEALKKIVTAQWELLKKLNDVATLKFLKELQEPLNNALMGLPEDEVVAEIIARNLGATAQAKPVKLAEFEVLSSPSATEGSDQPSGDYFARHLILDPEEVASAPWMDAVEKVVLVHRLREVSALLGFTRFEASSPDTQGELEIGVKRAALARAAKWVPASETHGEGFFIQFRAEAVEQWLARAEVKARGQELLHAFSLWAEDFKQTSAKFPGLPYLMLHSLAHLLITSVALECGYPASSIRERIYAVETGTGRGYGILLYTGAVDAEGTLGGLVEVGRKITQHLHAALERGMLCSNDPVCAQHAPDDERDKRFLHGAACHGCLLIAETSCETFNNHLDRTLVVPTLHSAKAAFFQRGLM
jgi:hypothetical protein